MLVARKYPTRLVLGAADHTYVECGAGAKGWSCWGGKTGGSAFRQGAGSTRRADLIAGADEKAGIACYAINGVCHQCANRILFPTGALVRGARGYKVSEAIFGPYGRNRGPLGCRAPFDQHPGVIDDLPECRIPDTAGEAAFETDPDRAYVRGVMEIYRGFDAFASNALGEDRLVELHVALFTFMIRNSLIDPEKAPLKDLQRARADEERGRIELEAGFLEEKVRLAAFVDASNALIVEFQKQLSKLLDPRDYTDLLGLLPGDFVELVDPEIARVAYPGR
jgi:hypothetical protein